MNNWETLKSKIVYKNRWIGLRVDEVIKPDKTKGEYSFIEMPDEAVIVVPLDVDLNVCLIRITRYPYGKDFLELPKGRINKGEESLIAAKRELLEETGLISSDIVDIGISYPVTGVSDEVNHVFIARDLDQIDKNEMKEEGISEMLKIPLVEVLKMIKENKITDGQSISALMKAMIYLEKI